MRNSFFEKDLESACKTFKKLRIIDEDGTGFLKGEIEIIDNTGKLWDTYEVEIRSSDLYPYAFPKLFETNNAFPKITDWHVNVDGSCCVDITPNEIIICKDGLSLVEYIERFAVPYLANQTFRIREGYYLYGEYAHGIFGRIEFYQNKLKAKNHAQLMEMFKFLVSDYKVERTANCPFCVDTKFRKCHRDAFKELHNIRDFICFDVVTQLRPFLKQNPTYKLPQMT